MAAAVSSVRPDIVFHLAGISKPADLNALYKVNVLYAANLLDVLREHAPSAVTVVVGSCAEYGRQDGPVAETAPCRPLNAYGASKLCQTNVSLLAARLGQNVIVARLFNVVGNGMPTSLALAAFIQRLHEARRTGGCIRTGNLSGERDYLMVADVCRVLYDVVRAPRAVGEVVNICSGQAIRTSTLLDVLTRKFGFAPEVVSSSEPERIPQMIGDPAKLISLVGWRPRFDLEEALGEMYEASQRGLPCL
jgi:GDP-4-dehydro-6-deoxy-D-mannose reductase